MSAHRDYAYSAGEDHATDAYIESIAGKRDSGAHEMHSVQEGGTTWYSQVNDGETRYRNAASRVVVLVVSGLLVLAGIGICILGRVEKDHKVLPLCPNCAAFVNVMYIFGGCVIVFALLGIGAAVSRLKPLAFLYAFLILLLAIGCIAAGFAVVVYETGMKETEIEKLWNEAVADDEQFICTLQDRLKCSGFHACCNVVGDTIRSTSTCNATLVQVTTQCDWRCNATNFANTEPCNQKVEDLVKSHYKPLIGVTFGLAFFLIFVAVAAVRMTLRSR